MDVYDRIHAREPVKDVLQYISDNNVELEPTQFLNQLEVVQERNSYYAKQFLKLLIPYLEKIGSELSETVYEPYINLLAVNAPDPQSSDIIQYRFGSYKLLIKETPSLICAQGTTGFRTWEAALFLCHFITQNPHLFATDDGGSSMLELGCGTGIISILYTLMQKEKEKENKGSLENPIFVTDGDSSLLQQVKDNFLLNDITAVPELRFQRLRWNEDELLQAERDKKVGLILGADITYDTSVIPDLVGCLKQFAGADAYISCTERNMATLEAFENELTRNCLDFEIVATISPESFKQISVRNITTSIRIYRVRT